jgi:hypothetical protein
MEFFYDGQIKRYLTQFMRLMSGFSYQNASGGLVQVPVRYGDMTRQVGAILNKNSENILQSAPFIACYIKDVKFDRNRMQDPTFVSKFNVRERQFGYVDENPDSPTYGETIQEYANVNGGGYTVERLMPTPYLLTFNADIWTTNTDQKFQLWEQITVLFNPSLELQTTDNYIDWTSLSVLELTENSVFESRTVPQGLNNDLSIATLQFTAPAWITPPAKVKKLGIVTKIITNVFAEPTGTGASGGYDDAFMGGDIFGGLLPDAKVTVSSDDYDLLILNNTAALVPVRERNVSQGWVEIESISERPSWINILDKYPGKFIAGISQLRLTKSDGTEIVASMSLNPTNEGVMALIIDQETIPPNTPISDATDTVTRGTVDAIINPQTFNPGSVADGNIDRRYLILEDININPEFDEPGYDGPDAWKNINLTDFQAHANDIIQWDGQRWWILFDSTTVTDVTYITNAYTGIQYKWEDGQWMKSFEGVYTTDKWRLIL